MRYIILLIILGLLCSPVKASYSINRLYEQPSLTSKVVFEIPIKITIIERQEDWFLVEAEWNFFLATGKVRGWIKVPAISRLLHKDIMNTWARKLNIPAKLLYVVQIKETGHISKKYRARAVSPSGAIGIMQIMPYHAKSFNYKIKDLYNPKINIEISAKLLAMWYQRYKSIEKTLAAYNGGDRQALLPQHKRCKETRNYVARGLKLYEDENTL